MELKERLVQARKAQGLSQEELAAQVGVSRQAVSKWETGDALPDLPKLLALAETLDMSLDALCGRESPAQAPAPERCETAERPRRRRRPALFLLLLLLLAGSFYAGMRFGGASEPEPEAPPVPPLPDTLSAAGVSFSGDSNGVSYQFTPSIAGEAYTYQITFKGHSSPTKTVDARYSGGICSGALVLSAGSYNVTAVISNGQESRAVPLAIGLNFSPGSASWTPVE
jgi:transcriptional regulator with XRE-family HTH domain